MIAMQRRDSDCRGLPHAYASNFYVNYQTFKFCIVNLFFSHFLYLFVSQSANFSFGKMPDKHRAV